MYIALGVLAEDDGARRLVKESADIRRPPIFKNNEGPFVDAWFGEEMLFGLIERVAPNDFMQVAWEGEAEGRGDVAMFPGSLHVAGNLSFIIRLSSVPHASVQKHQQGGSAGESLANCTRLIIDYASMLRSGARAEVAGSDTTAEFIRFAKE